LDLGNDRVQLGRVNWFSPTPLTTGSLCDPQMVILELEGGVLIFDELFVKSG
jgi:hypothetical protein